MFVFEKYEFEQSTKIASFYYKLNDYIFVEKLDFSLVDAKIDISWNLKENLLLFLHLLLWISYYKLTCEKQIIIKVWKLNKKQSEFFNTLYTKGLWEFFYQNNLDFNNLINFPYWNESSFKFIENWKLKIENWKSALVPVWWWKDSSVVLSLFEKNNIPFEVFTLWEHPIYESVSKSYWKTPIVVKRSLDPLLIKLNKTWKYYNGHIPISSIIAWVSLVVSAMRGCEYIILANEQSANVWNTVWKGIEINHQYSKSLEFEQMIQEFILENITNITYFSLLRPFTELKIAKLFSENCTKVFDKFSSCNKNFKLFKNSKFKINSKFEIQNSKLPPWCCICPKCAFVFAMLSPFLWIKKTSQIFWKNLFEDENLVQIFLDLAGFWNIKPFECVWLKEEVQVAFSIILKKEGANWMIVLEEMKKYSLISDSGKYLNSFEENLISKEFLKLF